MKYPAEIFLFTAVLAALLGCRANNEGAHKINAAAVSATRTICDLPSGPERDEAIQRAEKHFGMAIICAGTSSKALGEEK